MCVAVIMEVDEMETRILEHQCGEKIGNRDDGSKQIIMFLEK